MARAFAIALTWTAGFVDAVGYLAPLLAGLILETGKRRGIRPILSVPLTLEAALLLGFMLAGTPFLRHGSVRAGFYAQNLITAMAALAMGMQNATLTKAGPVHVYATHVTGAVTKFGEDAARYIFWFHDAARMHGASQALRESRRQPDFVNAVFFAASWAFFTGGAAAGAFAKAAWQLWSLAIPLALLAVLVTVNLFRPLPAEHAD